jgi:hypothetical protein
MILLKRITEARGHTRLLLAGIKHAIQDCAVIPHGRFPQCQNVYFKVNAEKE